MNRNFEAITNLIFIHIILQSSTKTPLIITHFYRSPHLILLL